MGSALVPFLCIDGGRKVGWALSRGADTKPLSGVREITRPAEELGKFGSAFNEWLTDMIGVHGPRRIHYEVPIIPGHEDANSVLRLYGLATLVETIAWIYRIPVRRENNQRIKKFFAGYGRAEKIDMVRICHERGWYPQDHNEADALAMMAMAEHEVGIKRDHGPMFRGAA